MRYVFLIFFLFFAALPVMADLSPMEQVSVEAVDTADLQSLEADDFYAFDTLYVGVPETRPTITKTAENIAGFAPPLVWRPPIG